MYEWRQLWDEALAHVARTAAAAVAPFTIGGKLDRGTPNAVGRTPPEGGGTGHSQGAEPPLGNPAADGYVLASTTGGVRSWVPQAAAPTTRWDLLTNGDPDDPALVFADGDVIWLEVPL